MAFLIIVSVSLLILALSAAIIETLQDLHHTARTLRGLED